VPELTSEQRRAVEVEGGAAVRAGAGSGKTTVLAERFLHLLRPRADGTPGPVAEVGQILAITFTERAAAEMRRKIRELLAHETAAAPERLRPHWEAVRRDLLGAQISTIHAFCARVLRENPIEAGIDPEATVLDEHESRAYVERVVEDEIVGRLRAGDPAARAFVRRHRLVDPRTGGAVGVATALLGRLATTDRDAAWLVAATARQDDETAAAAAEMRAAAARVAATVADACAARPKHTHRLAAAWPRWGAFLAAVGPATPLEEFLTLAELCRLLAEARLGRAVAADLRLEQDTGRLRGALPDAYGFVAARADAARLAALLGEVARALAARKRADAVLTFGDMIAETRALLAREPGVARRYAERFRAVLVDEFQDTDAVQAEVIRLLATGTPAPVVFVVGDEKQSIYRFRGADIAVFKRIREEMGRTLSLGTSFRSQPGILRFVNALAAHVLNGPGTGAGEHWTGFDETQHLVPHRAQTWPGPGVRLVSFVREHARRRATKRDLPVAEARELEARVLAGLVARLRADGVASRDVAVLFRTLNQVKAYEYALRRREIPYYVVKGRGFFQCQEVGDVVALLAAVADASDGIALAAALRSPFFAVDDDTLARLAWPADAARAHLARRFRRGEFADVGADARAALGRARELLRRLRRLRHRASIAELLEEAFASTDFEAVLLTQFQGAQKVANVRKLIEFARDQERGRHAGLRDFVRTVRALAAHEPREPEAPLVGETDDVVRLMTIHQAKGLEFPVVVVPDLGRQLAADNATTVLDERLGVLTTAVDAAGRMRLGNRALEAWRAREQDRERAEQGRLLYVACTRAKDLLVLLEGKGDPRWLEEGRGDGTRWCHQVWDVVGRARVAAFAKGSAARETVVLANGAEVLLEAAEEYVAEAAPPRVPAAAPRTAAPTAAETDAVRRVLEFRAPAPRDVVTTPTALAAFRRCPRQYWLRHVAGVAERGSGGARAALLGTAAHGVLETVDLAAAPDAEIARRLEARLEALVLPRRERVALAADLVAAARVLRAEVAAGLAIVGREVPFVLALPAGARRVVLQGRIDLLARRGDDLLVRDYKYAAATPDGGARSADQLDAYRLAVATAEGARVGAELVFLRGGPAVVPLPPLDLARVRTDLAEAGVALGDALADGAAEAFPKAPPARNACEALGCGYVRRCWGGAAA